MAIKLIKSAKYSFLFLESDTKIEQHSLPEVIFKKPGLKHKLECLLFSCCVLNETMFPKIIQKS